ncbi:hypothetical protein CHS0354_032872 [Potamilus streckersoni]|uniref:Cyclic GMP-AMP synthase n=1 Tax=Potamilus streckersoni TaxID=2493646 RepID=A0AAE0T1R9_9BIVA|nr:hypothetical protein CHS0354_032872 [Potamilus streckersoni]
MTDQVLKYYHAVSKHLSNILDEVGYSRKDRERKVICVTNREVFSTICNSLSGYNERDYIIGSRGEGSTGPGLLSDLDILFQSNDLKLVTDLTDCQTDKFNFLMVKDNFTHPGYVKLQKIVFSGYTPIPIYNMQDSDKFLTIDSLKRSVLLNTLLHSIGPVSGPSLCQDETEEVYSSDFVLAVRCSQWPQEAFEWFQRRRLYGWPTPKQIENAWRYGCFVVPVGHPVSSEQHLEWRLSFSLAERDITRSFQDTVMKVYILLKMIKETYIKPYVGDAFSSFHCKVCILWTREKTPLEMWRIDNILYCLILCIRQLYEWAISGFCPDYFIVTNNIFDRKIVGANQFHLVQILRYLLSEDSRFLLGIKTCFLGQLLASRISRLDTDNFTVRKLIIIEVNRDYVLSIESACVCRYAILKQIPQSYEMLAQYLQRLVYVSTHLPYIIQYPMKYAMMLIWSQLGFSIATVCKENARDLFPEQADYLVALASCCIYLGIGIDTTSVRLKLCGLGMELGNYYLTEVCLQQINDYLMRYMYSATVVTKNIFAILECNWNSFNEKLHTKRYSTEELLQTQVSFSVVYMPTEIPITPSPLRMEMFRSIGVTLQLTETHQDSWYNWGVVDSLMCLYFFQYLNFSRQGKERHRKAAIANMIHVIQTEPNILHKDTALNLLGYSYMQVNRLTSAFTCFTRSLKIRPYHNAAKFYLGILFKNILVTHRRHGPY